MTLAVSVSRSEGVEAPDDDSFRRWIAAVLDQQTHGIPTEPEICLSINDTQEMAELNHRFRGKTGATNVLSFPADLPPGLGLGLLGDIAICAPVVAQEAKSQQKPEQSHWAHMTVHGVLHLLGYDHINDADAVIMEQHEIRILATLGFDDPYRFRN